MAGAMFHPLDLRQSAALQCSVTCGPRRSREHDGMFPDVSGRGWFCMHVSTVCQELPFGCRIV